MSKFENKAEDGYFIDKLLREINDPSEWTVEEMRIHVSDANTDIESGLISKLRNLAELDSQFLFLNSYSTSS